MLVITAVICIMAALLNSVTLNAVIVVFFIDLVLIILIWAKPLSKKSLYLLNILNLLGAACLAYLIINKVIKSTDSFIAMIIIIAVMDVFSFTRKGRKTPNARLMNNTNALARLCICLPVTGKPGLQPIIGVGDLYFYSAILLFNLNMFSIHAFGRTFFMLLVGQLGNIIVISIIKNKSWFKGFPATLFPGLFCILSLFLRGI